MCAAENTAYTLFGSVISVTTAIIYVSSNLSHVVALGTAAEADLQGLSVETLTSETPLTTSTPGKWADVEPVATAQILTTLTI